MNTVEEDRQITQLIDRLHRRYPHLPASTVSETVESIRQQFTDRPIRDFVPLFIERRAIQTLATPTARE